MCSTRFEIVLSVNLMCPTLIVLSAGKLSEPKIDELIDVLQGNPAVVWNLRYVDLS